jgi:hypothetical protein
VAVGFRFWKEDSVVKGICAFEGRCCCFQVWVLKGRCDFRVLGFWKVVVAFKALYRKMLIYC